MRDWCRATPLCWARRVCVIGGAVVALGFAWPGIVYSQADLDRRITNLESLRLDARQSTIEAQVSYLRERVDSMESVGKGILVAVIAQLILSGLSLHKRNRGPSDG